MGEGSGASFGFFTADYAEGAGGFWWDKVDGPDGRSGRRGEWCEEWGAMVERRSVGVKRKIIRRIRVISGQKFRRLGADGGGEGSGG